MTALILLKDWNNSIPEVWLPIKDFLGYEVSNKGNVRSFWRKSGCGRPGLITNPNHRNNIPYDNRVDNLEWMTISENTLHGNEIGTGMRGAIHGMAKLTETDILFIRANITTFTQAKEYVAELPIKITPEAIMRIITRKTWKHI